MGNFNFNLFIMGLGAIYLLSPFVHLIFIDDLKRMHWFLLIAFGVLAASPLFLTFYLVWRRMKQMANDEFEQLLLRRQMMFASTAALCHVAIFGFVAEYDVRGDAQPYYASVFWWYTGWLIASMSFRREYDE
jgi:hypothetical protein